MRDDSNNKGFCFIQFEENESVNKALEQDGNTPEWNNGRYINVSIAQPRKPRESFGGGGGGGEVDPTTIFVGNLSWDSDENSIKSAFESCGAITSVRVATKPDGQSRGFCHIQFESPDSIDKALALSGTEIDGRAVRVDRSGGRGGGGGGFGGDRGGRGRGRGDRGGRGRGRGDRGGRGRGRGDRGGRGRGRGDRGGRGRGRGGPPSKQGIKEGAGKKVRIDDD